MLRNTIWRARLSPSSAVSPFVCIFCQKTGPNLERHLTTKNIGQSVSPEVPPPEPSFAVKTESLMEILRKDMVNRRKNPQEKSKKFKQMPVVVAEKEPKPKAKAIKKKRLLGKPKQVKKKTKNQVILICLPISLPFRFNSCASRA
jgi:FKBP-type peptidyl-prolyl cis-trans isomerase 2